MNTKILQKILEELNKEKPSIDYMKGMVETLMEISGSIPITKTLYETTTSEIKGVARTETISDEDIALQRYNGGLTGKVTS